VLKIPAAKSTTITQPGMDTAISKTQTLKQYMDSLHDKTLTIRTNNIITTTNVTTGLRYHTTAENRAAGGLIPGPPATSDTVPAWLSTGEYVVKAAAVEKYGATFFDRLNGMRFASGGVVPPAAAAPVQVSRTGPLLSVGQIIAADPDKAARALRREVSSAIIAAGIPELSNL
jgi:pyridoxal biosynthesis lyase PdxS